MLGTEATDHQLGATEATEATESEATDSLSPQRPTVNSVLLHVRVGLGEPATYFQGRSRGRSGYHALRPLL